MSWKGLPSDMVEKPAKGETMLGAGGFDQTALDLSGTFTAKTLGIEPQPIQLRLFAEDYFPNRERVYSPPYTLYVLSPEQHAIWITEQLNRWHRQALEVRDRELQLYETNKQLRELTADELDQPENRSRSKARPAAERANGRRLSTSPSPAKPYSARPRAIRKSAPTIWKTGPKWSNPERHLRPTACRRLPICSRRPPIANRHRRMPSLAKKSAAPSRPIRAAGGSPGKTNDEDRRKTAAVPALIDIESSQQPSDGKDAKPAMADKTNRPANVESPRHDGDGQTVGRTPPTTTRRRQKVDQAVTEQKDLLAEFEKIADKLNKFSPTSKAARSSSGSKLPLESNTRSPAKSAINSTIPSVSNWPGRPITREVFTTSPRQRTQKPGDVSFIMDDMQAYFERRQLVALKNVLDEMRQPRRDRQHSQRRRRSPQGTRPLHVAVRVLVRYARPLGRRSGRSRLQRASAIANPKPACRRPSSSKSCKFSKAKSTCAKIPASPQQAKAALAKINTTTAPTSFPKRKNGLDDRIAKVIDRIRELPDARRNFPKEIALLAKVDEVMVEATDILAQPETGKPAIAAETEAIELLLQSKRINPKVGWRRRRDSRRRRRRHDQRFRPGYAGRRHEPKGSPRRSRRLASGGSVGPRAPRGIPRRIDRILQPAGRR